MDWNHLSLSEGTRAAYRVHVCLGPNCSGRGSNSLLQYLERAVATAGLTSKVEIIVATCRDRCDWGPSINVYPGPIFYNRITEAAIDEIVREHFLNDRPVDRWLFLTVNPLGAKTRK